MAALTILVILVLGLLLFYGQWDHRQQALARIAHNFKGEWDRSDWFYPQLRLRILDYPATLGFASIGDSHVHTHLAIDWPHSSLRCEIYPQGILSGLRRLVGMGDIEIGSPQFDETFFITGNDESAIRELLTPAVQSVITRLMSMRAPRAFNSRDIFVKWTGGTLTVTKPFDLSTYESLEEFIGLTSELVVAASASFTQGISFTGNDAPKNQEPLCPICGEALATDLVHCESCRTPHHRDCWEYFGGCSTYACGHKKHLAGK